MIHIMMATYNGEAFICEQVDSILSQTYTDWKLYISDDGSTDHTLQIVEQYINTYPEKICLVEHCENFCSAKKNFAFLYRKTPPADYYAFCDQDDIWEKDKLMQMLVCIETGADDEPALCYHDMQVGTTKQNILADSFSVYSGCRLKKGSMLQQILLCNTAPGCAMLFNRKLKELATDISEDCIMHDWWMMLVVLCLDGRVIFCDQKLSLYRQHEKNQIGAVKKKNVLQIMLQCLDLIRIRHYITNNQRVKIERIQQARAILEACGRQMSIKNVNILEMFLDLMTSGHKLRACVLALKNGYIFYNWFYTVKLFLL